MSESTISYESLLIAGISFIAFEYYKCYKNYLKYEAAYWSERRGRAQVEREMKRISNIQLNTSEGFFIQPIGHIESCYRHCIGTPRQGLLVPESRASLKLTTNMSPEALDGLEKFSHVWISFKFHLNTNTLKESKAFSKGSTFTAKISLPMLKGTQKIGVLATRSPHRPNPIGITLAQVDRVDKKNRTVYLKACDLVNGTPVLDVKPYVPAYDTVPSYRIPPWLSETVYTRNTVTVDKKCYDQVKRIQGSLYQYKNDPDMFMKALIETLEAEVRSRFQTDRRMQDSAKEMMVEVLFDETVVKYNWPSERVFEVVEIELQSESKTIAVEAQKLRLDDDMKAAAAAATATSSGGANTEDVVYEEDEERSIPQNSELSF